MAHQCSFEIVSEIDLQGSRQRGQPGPQGNRAALRLHILESKLAKCQVLLKALNFGKIEEIEKEDAKTIVKMIKESKIRVWPQMMDNHVRVAGKNKDDLQSSLSTADR